MIEIPEDIRELFLRELNNTATDDEREKLFMFIEELLASKPDLKLTRILRDLGFDLQSYNRFMQRYRKWRQEMAGEKIPKGLKRLETKAFAKFVRTAWEEVRDIALDVVMGWYDRAKEMGYYNPESQKVDMRKFIEDAVTFYTQYRYSIDIFEEQYRDLEALTKTLIRMLDPQIARLVCLKLYMNFILKILELNVYGIPVPEELIYEVKEMVNKVIVGSPPSVRVERYE